MDQNAEPEFSIIPHSAKKGGLGAAAPAPAGGMSAPAGGVRPGSAEEPEFRIGQDIKFERGPLSAGDVAVGALTSFVPSAIEFGKSVAYPFLNPVETAQAVGGLGKGLYSKAAGALGVEQDPEEKARVEAPVEALKQFYGQRYGDLESFKRTVASDPVGVLADISTPLTLGGAGLAKMPGTIGKVGAVTRKAGEVIDPLAATAKVAAAVPKVPAAVAAWKSGTSFRSMDQAAKAGMDLNPVFWQHLSGQGTPEEVVGAVKGAVQSVAKRRSDEYLAGLDAIRSSQKLPFDDVIDTLGAQRSIAYAQTGPLKNEAARQVYQRVENALDSFINNKHPDAHTITDFNEMKQAVNNIANDYRPGSPERRVADQVAQSIGATIRKADPRYADIMEAYGKTSDLLQELSKELLGSNKATVAQRMRKILKDQDKATKGALLEELARINPDIPYMIAGQELSELFPQGIRGALTSTGAIYGAGPMGALTVPLMSPRFGGGMQYGLGAVAGVPGQIEKRVPAPLRAGAYGAGEATQALQEAETERTQRASGGRTRSSIAESLMRAAERAKRELSKETEVLLEKPDEHIAKALQVAKQHI